MIPESDFSLIVWVWIAISVPVFILLQFIVAPFGRHTRSNFGPMLNNRIAWLIMELVSLIMVAGFFYFGNNPKTSVEWFIVSLWIIHYANRSLIYPFRQKDPNKRMPVAIFLSAIFFNLINGGLNGYYMGWFATYDDTLFSTWHFWIGLFLFMGGMSINIKSDNILLRLRKPGESGYKIPQGFLFKYISCPNHFGEIIEWIGFAIITLNLASISFAIWTFANLAPRAFAHHKWYKEKFDKYPIKRKALIPFVV